jgi:hypothetical protein
MHSLDSLIVHVVRSPRHLEYARTFQCLCSTNSHLLIDLHSNTTLLAFDSLVFRRRLTLLVEDTQPGQGREPSRASLPRTAASGDAPQLAGTFAKWEEGLRPAGLPAHGDMVPRSTIPASPSVVPQLSTGPPDNSFESFGTLANWGFNCPTVSCERRDRIFCLVKHSPVRR